MPESAALHIRQGKVGEGKFSNPEAGGAGGFGSGFYPLTEKRELKAVIATCPVMEGSCGIPPLGFELPVGAVILGKFISPSRFRGTPSLPGPENGGPGKGQ